MVAKVLIINDYKVNIYKVTEKLQYSYNAVLFSRSMEDSIRIIGTQFVDIVILALPKIKSNTFLDFFAVLRQLCGVIPIIGIFEKNNTDSLIQYSDIGIDDFVFTSTSKTALLKKIHTLTSIKNMFDDNLLVSTYFTEKRSQKMATFFYDNLDFLHSIVRERSEIIELKSWPVIDDLGDCDMFLINSESTKSNECCSALRLRKINRYKPIILTYNSRYKSITKNALAANIGCTDRIDIAENNIIIANRLNSFMKYSKMYESFTSKLKKSLYLSAIDSTTGVYNRSFLEDYIKNHGKKLTNLAIMIIDIDKFKQVNDKYGHSFADSVLKYVSATIKRYVRSSDIVARYGGDEFIALMDNVSKKTIEEISCRIQKTIEVSQFRGVYCTVSVGVCCVEANCDLGIYDAISVADKFMYTAKQNGGNSVSVCA
jgi:diguanylate cyclase (GGDEF)-like protein